MLLCAKNDNVCFPESDRHDRTARISVHTIKTQLTLADFFLDDTEDGDWVNDCHDCSEHEVA